MDIELMPQYIQDHFDAITYYLNQDENGMKKFVEAYELQAKIDELQGKIDSIPAVQAELSELQIIKTKSGSVDL